MSRLPFPVNEDWTSARGQIEELLRVLYEERIGGLKASDSIVSSKDSISLFLGLANQKLFVNADADGHEWDYGFDMQSGTRDISLTTALSLTGCDFKPRAILLLLSVPATEASSIGFSTASLGSGICEVPSYGWTAGAMGLIAVDVSNYSQWVVNTLDDNGVTFTFSKTGTPTGTASYVIGYFR